MIRNIFLFAGWVLLVLTACNKFIDKKADAGISAPSTVAGYRTLLEQDLVTIKSTPGLGPGGCDDYRLDSASLQSTTREMRGVYSWDPSFYQGATDDSWGNPYQAVYQCNLVLDGLGTLSHGDSGALVSWSAVRSEALFLRSFHFLCLQECYGQPWRPGSNSTDMGIPLRLSSNGMKQVGRATVKDVFFQVMKDVKDAIPYLPDGLQTESPNRPCKAAGWALLARAALIQQDYVSAKAFADSCLALWHTLLRYDTVQGPASHPFYAVGNPEVLFQCSAITYPMVNSTATTVDSGLYAGYDSNDLRKALFFKTSVSGRGVYFRGNYSIGRTIFSGSALDEVVLIRAECRARLQDPAGALDDLNTLLVNRYKPGTYRPYTSAYDGDVLSLVLWERRKELLFRGLRWSDLRRLNQQGAGITLKRVLGDSTRTLPPNSAAYSWQIPLSEVGAGQVQQNPQ